jgi:hypothetical protein
LTRPALLAFFLVLGLFPATAAAGPVVSVKGASGPGPSRYGSVSYERFGPASAKRVLILVPGTQGGAGDFSLVGPEIVRRVKGLQVWAYERRTQALEDHGEVSPIRRVAQLFGRSPVDATEWYFPVRLTLDVDGASGLRRSAVTKLLGLRTFHRHSIDLPLYALQTDLTHGRVLRGARRLIAATKIPARRSRLVDASATNSHLDPLTSAPRTSRFLKTVIAFLRRR